MQGRRQRRAEPEKRLVAGDPQHLARERRAAAEAEARNLAVGRDPDLTPLTWFCQNSDNDAKSGAMSGRDTALAESGGGPRDDYIAARNAPWSEI